MLELLELDGDHSDAERDELHAGEENPFESVDLGIVWADHERRIAIRDDGRLIASAGLLIASVQAGGATFDVVGFGGVIVTRARRGEGLARRVMEAAIARAAELGPERGLLFCRPDRAGLYAKLGFERLRAPVDVAQPGGRRAAMPLHTMWRPLKPDADWPAGEISLPGLPF